MSEKEYRAIEGTGDFRSVMLNAYPEGGGFTRTHTILQERAYLDCYEIYCVGVDVRSTVSKKDQTVETKRIWARGDSYVIDRYVIPDIERKTGWKLEEVKSEG